MLSIIVAIDQKRGLGKNNQLLFKIKKDLRRFRRITLGKPVVMGRKTFQSMVKPLPQRINIVVSRNRGFHPQGTRVFHSLAKAINFAQTKGNEVFVIGGAQIYKQTIDQADRLYLTLVKGDYQADAFFPEYKNKGLQLIEDSGWQKEREYQFKFLTLVR